jgi:hypothetical protein
MHAINVAMIDVLSDREKLQTRATPIPCTMVRQ